MAIEGVTGLPGEGKTLYAVKMLLRARKEGKRCFANFTSVKGEWERVRWDQIVKLEDAFVVIDEAHMWFPSRAWKEQTQAELGIFQQHRKVGLDLVWIAQNEARVDVALRELTAFNHFVRRGFANAFSIVLKLDGVNGRVCGREMFIPRHFYGHYYTEERVLGRGEVSDAPIVGVFPNLARYERSDGSVMWVKREDSATLPERLDGAVLTELWYVSKFSGQRVLFEDLRSKRVRAYSTLVNRSGGAEVLESYRAS